MQGVKGTTSLVTKLCQQCGQEFSASYKKQKFCSKYCGIIYNRLIVLEKATKANRGKPSWNKGISNKVERTCEACGKVFYLFPSEVKKGTKRFCSFKCRGLVLRGENNPCFGRHRTEETKEKNKQATKKLWQDPEFVVKVMASRTIAREGSQKHALRVERVCEICGERFFARQYHIRKGQARFCSRRCHHDYLIVQASISKICETCSKEFIVKRHQSARRFCSIECMGIAKRDKVGFFHTAEWKQNRSNAQRGIVPPYLAKYYLEHGKYPSGEDSPRWGRLFSPEQKERHYQAHSSEAFRKKMSVIMSQAWQDPEYVRKTLKGVIQKPTNPERKLIEMLNKHFPDFRYNGDFSLGITLGGLIPDFVNVNGRKEVIEVFGDYWHSLEVIGNNWRKSELGKLMTYNSLGYKCLVIWEHDLKEKSEDEIVDMIKTFAGRRMKCRA